jgi:hypothetical protein
MEIIAVCSEIHTKHINTLCGQNVELLNVKAGGTYSNHIFTSACAVRPLCRQCLSQLYLQFPHVFLYLTAVLP